jgi:hypothetical protein
MWILNGNAHLKYNIPHSKKCFILVSYWLVFTVLVSNWSAFTFLISNTDSRKYADISLYYPNHEGAKAVSYAYSWVGKSAVCYPHHEDA